MFILHIKKIIKNPAICFTIILLLVSLSYYLFLYTGSSCYGYLEGAICKMLLAVPYVFFVFIFLSYEIFSSYSKNNFNEVLCSRRISIKYQKYDFMIIVLIDVIATVMLCWFQIRFYKNRDYFNQELIYYSIRLSFIFWGMVNLFGILLGWIVSGVKSKLVGMCFLLTVYFIFDQSFLQLLMLIAEKNYSMWRFSTIFCIFNTELVGGINDYYYLMSAENVHIFRILFWIFLALFILFQLVRNHFWIIWGALTIVFLVLFFVPSGASYSLPVSNCFDRWFGEQFYYPQVSGDTLNDDSALHNDFLIKKYNILLQVDDILKASVEMDLNNGQLSSYQFTLYHCYHVTSVKNENGEHMKFKQEGDYLTVYRSQKKLSKLIISYQGGSQYFYSTKQGIMLPANFEYYPIAGHKTTFINNSCNRCFTRDISNDETDFHITVSYNNKLNVFSNLKEVNASSKKGKTIKEFRGSSNGVTIIGSPYLCKENMDEVTILYSSLDRVNDPTIEDNRKAYKELFKKMNDLGHSLNGKTFIVAPDNNLDNYCFASDHIVNQQFKTYDEAVDYYKYGKLYQFFDETNKELMKKVEEQVNNEEGKNGE